MKAYIEQPRTLPKVTPQKAVQLMMITASTLTFLEQVRTYYMHYSAMYNNRKKKRNNSFGFGIHR